MVRKIVKKLIKDKKKKTSPKKTTPKNAAPKRRGRPPKSATQKPKATGVTKKPTGVTKKAPPKKITSRNIRRRNKSVVKPVPVKKTPTTGQKVAAAGITGGVIAAGTLGKKKDMDKMSFNEAFKTARAKLGTDKTFTWRGKKYSTVTMDEVKKAGFNTLAEYNRSKQSKGGKVAGQKGSQNLSKKKPSRSSDFRRKGSM